MDQLTYSLSDGTLSLPLSGRVDSASAPAVEEELRRLLAETGAERLTLDCEDLGYISSAGLRVLLRLKKSIPELRLVNVSSQVYEVLETTGFTQLLDIQKALRSLSVRGCEIIGEGANGTVCRIDRETVVKVYRNPEALPEIRRERELARTAFVLGIPTAIPFDVVRVEEGGYGSVFELLDAQSLARLLRTGELSVEQAAEKSIALLKRIHATRVKPDSVPDMRPVALEWADRLQAHLPHALHRKLRALLEAVPEDDHLLHGDFHIKNIMLQDGECFLIDMDSLCRGHPIFELAGMFNAYCGFSDLDPSVSRFFLGIEYETGAALWRRSLRLYLDGAEKAAVAKVEEKAQLLGYARIFRRCLRLEAEKGEDRSAEIENCRRHLAELLPRVDSLTF